MSVTVLVGTQWGDEGKGKITDIYAAKSDLIVRFQGGNNAGHTIIVGDEEYKLNLVPSGIVQGGKTVVLGNGMVVDVEVLNSEIEGLRGRGIDVGGLHISDKAHMIMPYHKVLDGLMESKRKGKKIGTTGRGIGPCYTDKISRIGIRFGDLKNRGLLKERLEQACEIKNLQIRSLGGEQVFEPGELMQELLERAAPIMDLITDTSLLINDAIDQGKEVFLEGAQGTFLDIDHGTYPFVTSSNTVSGGACAGAGIGPKSIDRVFGIVKAYTTRVGEGPFPAELLNEIGDGIQQKGKEIGTTTSRPRRCGWLDLVMLRTSSRLNGITHIAVTKIDVLGGLDELQVVTGYEYNGEVLKYFPSDVDVVSKCVPVLRSFPGWPDMTDEEVDRAVEQGYDSLPQSMKEYLDFLVSEMNVELGIVSLGPKRSQTIVLDV